MTRSTAESKIFDRKRECYQMGNWIPRLFNHIPDDEHNQRSSTLRCSIRWLWYSRRHCTRQMEQESHRRSGRAARSAWYPSSCSVPLCAPHHPSPRQRATKLRRTRRCPPSLTGYADVSGEREHRIPPRRRIRRAAASPRPTGTMFPC